MRCERLALCGIARMENNYIREWIAHYKDLGFDHIYLYDNNLPNGERIDSVIQDYILDGYVSLFDVRQKDTCQKACYNKCYKEYGKHYDYMAFFDIDEFLFPTDGSKSIKELISDDMYADYDAISLCWQIYDDNDIIKVVDGDYSLVSRFTRPCKENIFNIKTIYKCNLTEPNIGAHCPSNTNIRCCNSVGKQVATNGWCFTSQECNTLDNMYVRHYRQKTIEEFVLNRMVKGDGVKIANKNLHQNWFNVDYFFKYNEYTKEKYEYAQKLLKR